MSGTLLLLGAELLWGLGAPLSRIAFDAGLTTGALGFRRALFAATVLTTHGAVTGRLSVPHRDLPGVIGCGLPGEGVVLEPLWLRAPSPGRRSSFDPKRSRAVSSRASQMPRSSMNAGSHDAP